MRNNCLPVVAVTGWRWPTGSVMGVIYDAPRKRDKARALWWLVVAPALLDLRDRLGGQR